MAAGPNSSEAEMHNTAIEYLYRDASNYKSWNYAVLPGTVDENQIEEIFRCCDCGEFFIPEQVGLPADRLDEYDRSEDDHLWCELLSITATEEEPTVDVAAQTVYRRFLNAKDRWDPLRLLYCGGYTFDDANLRTAKESRKASPSRKADTKGIQR